MSENGLVQILEGALMAAGEPVSLQRIGQLFDDLERPSNDELRSALDEVASRCEGRGYELVQVASGYRFQVRQNLAQWVGRLWQERPQKYSRALLETLSLIAYRQPITRGEIEEIRGVAVSSNIIKTLQEREWVRIVGHRDVPGRPAMYATTRQFLDYFNLKSLEELPPLAEIKELDNLSGDLLALQAANETASGANPEGEPLETESVESELESTLGGATESIAEGVEEAVLESAPEAAVESSVNSSAESHAENAPTEEKVAAAVADEADGDHLDRETPHAAEASIEEAPSVELEESQEYASKD